MTDFFYYQDDIAIVGAGCVLPGADDPAKFWEILKKGEGQIQELSDERWNKSHHLDKNKSAPDKTYSAYAGEVSQKTIQRIKKNFGLKEKRYPRVTIMTLEAMRQCLDGIELPEDKSRINTILGLMNPDELYFDQEAWIEIAELKEPIYKAYREKFPDKNEKDLDRAFRAIDESLIQNLWRPFSDSEVDVDNFLMTSVLKEVNQQFGIEGSSFFVDAACASSLASIDVAVSKLRSGESDLVIAGGIESNLSPGAFVVFAKVSALSDEICLPYEKTTGGLSQGEGSVVFSLMRMEDAIKKNYPIMGVIRAVAGSSDGKTASLFQPTVDGQVLAYERAYSQLGEKRVDYIEGHGTGTQIGDTTELNSLASFFSERRFPLGSVKSIIGHTKGAAGASGLLKCLLVAKERLLPGSPYLKKVNSNIDMDLYIPKKNIPLPKRSTPYRFGVSSFGFGGTNFHLVFDQYSEKFPIVERKVPAAEETLLLSEAYLSFDEINLEDFSNRKSRFLIPPKSIPEIDPTQLIGLMVADKAFSQIGLTLGHDNLDKIMVISTSCTGLESLLRTVRRTAYDKMMTRILGFEKVSETDQVILETVREKQKQLAPISEDSGPGILNNVISGRIANAFNLKGKNYNLDSDFDSMSCAIDLAKRELLFNPQQLILIVSMDESLNQNKTELVKRGAQAIILTSESYCKKECYQPIGSLKSISHEVVNGN